MARLNTYPDDLRDRLISAAYERLQQESPEQMSLREYIGCALMFIAVVLAQVQFPAKKAKQLQ